MQKSKYSKIFFAGVVFCGLSSFSCAAKYQFFLGLGQSITEAQLTTEGTNQTTHNTSSVAASGGYTYTNTQLGNYEGAVKNITNIHLGVEATIDRREIFTIRGYLAVNYSNHANFGNLDQNSVRDGDVRPCDTNEWPSVSNICYSTEFYPGGGSTTLTPFNPNPGFSNTITSNAFMLTYGVGADVGINIPINFLVKRFSGHKIIPLRFGIYGGGGYEFATYSLGHYDNRTYNNATPNGNTLINGAYTTSLNPNDTLYLAGGGAFMRFGVSLYITNHLRLDCGMKIAYANPEGKKWYQQESTANTSTTPDTTTQQLVTQTLSSKIKSYWQFTINVLF